MKRALARQWRRLVVLAAVLDIAMILTAKATGHLIGAFPVMFARWVVMMLGLLAINWAEQHEPIAKPARSWAVVYLILGFTAAATVAEWWAGRT